MASLSEKLRRERELRGISLKQIAEDTKIGIRFLEALEENRGDLIPGEFYRRSYLRAYVRYLGLDEERALNAYDFAHQAAAENGESIEKSKLGSGLPWLKWVLGAAALLGLSATMLLKPEPSVSSESLPPPALEPRLPARERVPETRASADEMPVIPDLPLAETDAASGLRVVLAVDDSCWLEIQADGEIVTRGLKDGGFRQEVTASKEVKLWIGNAGGISVWLNGRPARALGRAGQVRKDLAITPENYTEFLAAAGLS